MGRDAAQNPLTALIRIGMVHRPRERSAGRRHGRQPHDPLLPKVSRDARTELGALINHASDPTLRSRTQMLGPGSLRWSCGRLVPRAHSHDRDWCRIRRARSSTATVRRCTSPHPSVRVALGQPAGTGQERRGSAEAVSACRAAAHGSAPVRRCPRPPLVQLRPTPSYNSPSGITSPSRACSRASCTRS